jgi:hypothetical protein
VTLIGATVAIASRQEIAKGSTPSTTRSPAISRSTVAGFLTNAEVPMDRPEASFKL